MIDEDDEEEMMEKLYQQSIVCFCGVSSEIEEKFIVQLLKIDTNHHKAMVVIIRMVIITMMVMNTYDGNDRTDRQRWKSMQC